MTHIKSLLLTGYIAKCHDLSHKLELTSHETVHDIKFWNTLTLILPMLRIWWAPNSDSKWQAGFNSAFEGLTIEQDIAYISHILNW